MTRRLDHVVVVVPDLAAVGTALERLGFVVTPRSDHPFGTSNRLLMLPGCYVELVAVTRPDLVPEGGFADFVSAAAGEALWGPIMVVIASDDVAEDRARLQEMGLPAPEILPFARTATLSSGEEVEVGFEVAFTNLGDPGLGGFYCRHLTPHLLWEEGALAHPNGADGLAAVGLPHGRASTLAVLSELAGATLSDDGLALGGTRIETGHGTVSFLGRRRLRAEIPGARIEMRPR